MHEPFVVQSKPSQLVRMITTYNDHYHYYYYYYYYYCYYYYCYYYYYYYSPLA